MPERETEQARGCGAIWVELLSTPGLMGAFVLIYAMSPGPENVDLTLPVLALALGIGNCFFQGLSLTRAQRLPVAAAFVTLALARSVWRASNALTPSDRWAWTVVLVVVPAAAYGLGRLFRAMGLQIARPEKEG